MHEYGSENERELLRKLIGALEVKSAIEKTEESEKKLKLLKALESHFVFYLIRTFKKLHDVDKIAEELERHNNEILRKALRAVFYDEFEEWKEEEKRSFDSDQELEHLSNCFSALKLDLPKKMRIEYGLIAWKHFYHPGYRGPTGDDIKIILRRRNLIAEHIPDEKTKEKFLKLCELTENFIWYYIVGGEKAREAHRKLSEMNAKVFDQIWEVVGIDLLLRFL